MSAAKPASRRLLGAYERSANRYAAAANDLSAKALAVVFGTVQVNYPGAQAVVLEGHWNEDGELRIDLAEVWVDGSRLSAEDGNDDIEEVNDLLNEPLMDLASTTGDDYNGRTVDRLVEGFIPGLDDEAKP